MARGEPEHVAHRLALAAGRGLRERGRGARLAPAAALVLGTKDRRAEVPGLHRGEQRAAVARIEHRMVDGLAQEVGTFDAPVPRALAGREDEEALAGACEDEEHRLPIAATALW